MAQALLFRSLANLLSPPVGAMMRMFSVAGAGQAPPLLPDVRRSLTMPSEAPTRVTQVSKLLGELEAVFAQPLSHLTRPATAARALPQQHLRGPPPINPKISLEDRTKRIPGSVQALVREPRQPTPRAQDCGGVTPTNCSCNCCIGCLSAGTVTPPYPKRHSPSCRCRTQADRVKTEAQRIPTRG